MKTKRKVQPILTHDDVAANPRDLARYMPGVSAERISLMVTMFSDHLRRVSEGARKNGVAWSEREAACLLVAWYSCCSDELEAIRKVGLADWSSSRITPSAWATLEGIKALGVKDLPL